MRTTRFAASLCLATLAAAPILMAAKPLGSKHPPIAASASSAKHATTARTATKKFTLSVTIGGAYDVAAGSTGYLYTSVSGGTAPYTYTWYRNGWFVTSGSFSGQNPYFCCVGTDYFDVQVTDANGQVASAPTFFVHVH
jgi:hypothetical protein